MAGKNSADWKRGEIQTDENVRSTTIGEPTVNEFELERLRRIQRNKQVLADLGLENAAGVLLAGNSKQGKQRSSKRQQYQREAGEQVQQEQQPARRSRRLASQPSENDSEQQQAQMEFEELGPGGRIRRIGAVQQRHVCSSTAASKLDASAHHQHNMHRLNSMSEKALITRAWKITNVSKLKSFVQILEAAGMEAVLQEAREALQQLTGSRS